MSNIVLFIESSNDNENWQTEKKLPLTKEIINKSYSLNVKDINFMPKFVRLRFQQEVKSVELTFKEGSLEE